MTDEEARKRICPKTFHWENPSYGSSIFRFQNCLGDGCMAFQLKFINDTKSGFCKLLEGEIK